MAVAVLSKNELAVTIPVLHLQVPHQFAHAREHCSTAPVAAMCDVAVDGPSC